MFLTLPQSQSEWVHFTGTCFHSHHGWCGKPFLYICAVCSLMSVCLWWHLRCSPSESDWEQGEPSMAEDSQTKLKLQQVNWMNNTSSLFSPHYVCFHSNIVRCQQMTKSEVLVLDPNFRQTWFLVDCCQTWSDYLLIDYGVVTLQECDWLTEAKSEIEVQYYREASSWSKPHCCRETVRKRQWI